MKDSISIIIPAYNEEHSLEESVKVAASVVSKEVTDYEIIIVNDGSTDATGKIANRIRKRNSRVKVIHHKYNEGFGSTFKDGLRIASNKYITGFPADNDLYKETFRDIVTARKNDCIVITYMSDMSQRDITRQIISICYTKMMNFIFGLKLKYYNGYFICPAEMVKSLNLKSQGFTLFAEIKIKLIKNGMKYIQIPYVCAPRLWGASKALTRKSIIQTLSMIPILISDMHFDVARPTHSGKQ